MNHVKFNQATLRQIGQDVTIHNLITNEMSSELSLALAELAGEHPPTRSSRCTRAYFIVEGAGEVRVNSSTYEVSPGDAVLVPRGAEHSLRGTLRYVVVNAPAFDASLE